MFDVSLSALRFVGRGNAYTDWLPGTGRRSTSRTTAALLGQGPAAVGKSTGDRDAHTQERLRGAFFQQYCGPPGDKQRRQKVSYYGMIELIDEQAGRMLEALERTGQRDNTVVIWPTTARCLATTA